MSFLRSLFTSNEDRNTTVWLKEEHLFDPDTYRCKSCGKRFREPADVCPNCRKKVTEIKTDPTWVDEMAILDELDN